MSRDDSLNAESQSRPNSAQPMTLERKLELLEPRFTSPAGIATEAVTLPLEPSPSASRHSFSFDLPSGSRSSTVSGTSTASNLPASSVRPKRRPSKKISSLHAITVAADRQMRKVQAASPTFLMQQDQERSMSALASPPISNASASNQTILTSHVKQPSIDQPPQVVAESPPTLTSPAAGQKPAEEIPSIVRNVLGTVSHFDQSCF